MNDDMIVLFYTYYIVLGVLKFVKCPALKQYMRLIEYVSETLIIFNAGGLNNA